MPSWPPPTAEEVRRVALLSGRPEARVYFFDRLENPNWVAALHEAGFFVPPRPVPAGDGYVRFPPWAEGRYLARAAMHVPREVAAVLADVGQQENPAATRELLEAVGALPDEHLADLAPRVVDWIAGPSPEFFADQAVAVVRRLLPISAQALSASRSLLGIGPDPARAQKAAAGDGILRASLQPGARLSQWEYERALESLVPDLVAERGIAGVQLLAELLEDALRESRWDDADEADSYSYIWRPAVEDHSQNQDSDVRGSLVSGLRDAAVGFASQGPAELQEVVADLHSRSALHRRIGLYVVAVTDPDPRLISDMLSDRSLFDDHRLRHEYATLLSRQFAHADDEAQAAVLQWISDGPDVAAYTERRERLDGSSPTELEAKQYRSSWQRDWYSFIEEHLDEATAAYYHELVDSLGAPQHPDFVSWSSSWTGPESPYTANELSEREVGVVYQLLRSWRPDDGPPNWHLGPSMEGLGRALSEDVQTRPAPYAALAPEFAQLDPTYVRSLLGGLESGLREGKAFAWSGPLTLSEHAVGQPFEPDEEPPDRDRDPGWRWCRRQVASLIRTGFSDQANGIPIDERRRAWSLVERLLSDPNPSPEHEDRYGGDNMDPFTLSINTNRGTAMHAVVEYALWVRRALESDGTDLTPGFDLMPEARAALDAHLDPEVDPSLAVHAVYGRWLPWLLLLDEAWVHSRKAGLFPSEHPPYRDTVWATYIAWCPPYDSAFRALRNEYEAAVRAVPSGLASGVFQRASVDEKLGEHLVTFLWRGVADIEIVDEYFSRADDALASDVMEFVGRALQATAGDLAEPVRLRLQQFWDRRLSLMGEQPQQHEAELRAFGMTFASAKLDEEWALTHLQRSVELAGAPTLAHRVIERLLEVAASRPADASRIVASMLEHPVNEWDHIGWREEVRKLVGLVVRSGDAAAIEAARSIVDHYVRKGDLDFRELLRQS